MNLAGSNGHWILGSVSHSIAFNLIKLGEEIFLDGINKPLSDGPLTQSTIIGKLRAEFRNQIWQLARPIQLKKGQTLFIQEDPGDALYAVESDPPPLNWST